MRNASSLAGTPVESHRRPAGGKPRQVAVTARCLILALAAVLAGQASILGQLRIEGVSTYYDAPYLLSFSFSIRDQDGHSIQTHPTNLTVVCREDGLAISPLETGSRLVAGVQKQLRSFLVLDYTLSMADTIANGDSDRDGVSDAIETMQAGAKAFIGTLGPDAQAGIYEFHREDPAHPPRKVSALSSDKTSLSNHIDSIWADFVQGFPAASRCWDALYAAVSEFPEAPSPDQQRVVLFLSDGSDESSNRTEDEVIALARQRGVRLYGIGFGRELNSAPLEAISSATGGSYYPVTSLSELAARFREIASDLQAQYMLRWATLRRSGIPFVPSFELLYRGRTGTFAGPLFSAATHQGDVLQGRLRLATSVSTDRVASLVLRAEYTPRFVTAFRIGYATGKVVTVQRIPEAEGGLLPDDWVFEHDPVEGWIQLHSPRPSDILTALPFAASGKMLRLQVRSVTNPVDCFSELFVDSTLYAQGGQSFLIENGGEVVTPVTSLPHRTPPDWLALYGLTNRLIRAELLDLDGDGHVMWQEYAAGTNPTNRNSVFRIGLPGREATGWRISLPTQMQRPFRVEYSDDLRLWHSLSEIDVQGNAQQTSVFDPQPGRSRFYRLVGLQQVEPTIPPGMIWLPPGSFAMGSPVSEPDRAGDEGPRTVARITEAFWIADHEVTQEEYAAVTGSEPSAFKGNPNLPVENVSWLDAVDYCALLTLQERAAGRAPVGFEYRLPTEAEWEYACRAGASTRFPYGEDPEYAQLTAHAWFGSNSALKTHPRGQLQPNAWGLYDMLGNAWEWCLDWYGPYPGGTQIDPPGPASGSMRVVRGGSWLNSARDCRPATRSSVAPNYRDSYIGFRVVLAPVSAP